MLNFYGSFFTLIFAVLLVGANFYMKPRVLDNSYLQFKFELPTSDSTQITAGGPKDTPRRPLAGKIHVYLTPVL